MATLPSNPDTDYSKDNNAYVHDTSAAEHEPSNTTVQVISGGGLVIDPGALGYSETLPGPQPLLIECPLCREKIVTVIKHKNTKKTHGLACCICLLGGIFCAMIPYCLKAYNRVEHYCPNCDSLLGAYKK